MERKQCTILGVDPGTRVTGFGILQIKQTWEVLDYGCIKLPVKKPISYRYYLLFTAFEQLIARYTPDEIAVENQYFQQNFPSIEKLAGAKAALFIAAEKSSIPIAQYSPTRAKKAVTGNGLASKYQLQKTLQALLKLQKPPEPEDASDALCLAYCHANALKLRKCMNI